MKSHQRISILTPSLNQARWLPHNLASVAAQTYPNIEHIVMDGGSTDRTVEILHDAPNVTWTSEPDRGQSHALNKALAESSGDIIGWLNADDAYFVDDAVACVVEAFEEDPDVAVVYGHGALVSAENQLLHFLWVPEYSPRLLYHYNFIAQPAAFIHRRALEKRFIDEKYDSWMDRELWLRLARTYRFKRVNRVLAIDRHHTARKSYVRHLADADREKLAESYGVPWRLHNQLAHAFMRITIRLAGVRLLFGPDRRPIAGVKPDAPTHVLLRQVAWKRAQTTSGDETSGH